MNKQRLNHQINVVEVRIIQGPETGVMSHAKAMFVANENGMDLIEISSDASPPACIIQELGKWKYDQAKKQLRPGHTSRSGEGNQLSKYLNQIDRTVDFEGLSVEELVDLLPDNFSEWVGYARKELALSAKKKRKLAH